MSVPELTVTTLQSPAQPTRRVVVMPGLGTEAAAVWQPLAGELDPGWHVIALDLPGHGASPNWQDTAGPAAVPSMEQLAQAALDAIAREEALQTCSPGGAGYDRLPLHFAGISITGALALQLAADHPDRFSSVADICSLAKIGDPETWERRAQTVLSEGTAAMVEGNRARWFTPGFVEQEADRTESIMEGLRGADDASYAALCTVLGRFDLRSRLAEISVPVVAVAAEHDVVAAPEEVGRLSGQIPGGRLVLVEDASHQAAVEKPAQMADILNDFFGGPARED